MSTDTSAPAPVDAARERAVVAAVPTGLLVGGAWRDASTGAVLAVEDPSTGETLTEVARVVLDLGHRTLPIDCFLRTCSFASAM